jgi:THO complex subunit 1
MNVNIKALEEALKSYVLHPENAIAKLAVQINAQNVDMETLMVMIKRKTMQMVENQEKDFFQQITTLLDISVALVDKSAVEPNFVFVLIEDLLDVLTINYTELLFDYLESRVEKLVKDMLPNDRKALALLRSCNQLCRRLSKTKNTLALGRIKLFLSSVFPICEKSGVNRKGDFNTENITTLDTEASECKEEYTSMWDLQKYFSNPVLLYQNSCYRDMQNVTLY